MNKKMLFLFIGALIIYSCTTDPETIKDSYEISINEKFQFTLPSNSTTGYSWTWANKQTIDIVAVVSQEYNSNPNSNNLAGAGGTNLIS